MKRISKRVKALERFFPWSQDYQTFTQEKNRMKLDLAPRNMPNTPPEKEQVTPVPFVNKNVDVDETPTSLLDEVKKESITTFVSVGKRLSKRVFATKKVVKNNGQSKTRRKEVRGENA